MTFLIWEGENKSGKSSLIKAFNKATNYRYSNIDRFSCTSYCFGKKYNRQLEFDKYFKQDFKMRNEALLIFLDCPLDILRQRFKEHNEKDIDLDKDYEIMKNLYSEYLNCTPLKCIKIDTSKPIDECVQEIIEFIKQKEVINLDEEKSIIEKQINKFGEAIGNTKEIRNVDLEFELENLKFTDDNYMFESNEALYIRETLADEKPEYDQIFYDLKNEIRLKLYYFRNQDMFSRQFIHTSKSCISFIQFLYRNKILEMNVQIRSCNVKKMLLSDCLALIHIAKEINKLFFGADRIKFTVRIGSTHIFLKDLK